MASFEEKFKHLNFDKNFNFNDNDNEEIEKENQKTKTTKEKNNSKKEEIESKAAQSIFKELIQNIAKNTQQDKMFILFLITMLKNKKASNELILALLYIFL